MEGLRADVARLTFRVVRAFLDRDRDGLCELLIRVVLLSPAGSLNPPAEVVMAARIPVLFLAGRPAVARLAAAALLG